MKMSSNNKLLKIDLGCGTAKREGFIGIDIAKSPNVDYAIDLTKEKLPFPNESVDYVFSSHFFEHIKEPWLILSEIGRVCCDKATVEIWTPYAFHNNAFVYGHEIFFTEEIWMHFCKLYPDFWLKTLGNVRWKLVQINYVVQENVEMEIKKAGFSMEFAIKYFKNVAHEFGVFIEMDKNLGVELPIPKYTYSNTRDGKKINLNEFKMN